MAYPEKALMWVLEENIEGFRQLGYSNRATDSGVQTPRSPGRLQAGLEAYREQLPLTNCPLAHWFCFTDNDVRGRMRPRRNNFITFSFSAIVHFPIPYTDASRPSCISFGMHSFIIPTKPHS